MVKPVPAQAIVSGSTGAELDGRIAAQSYLNAQTLTQYEKLHERLPRDERKALQLRAFGLREFTRPSPWPPRSFAELGMCA